MDRGNTSFIENNGKGNSLYINSSFFKPRKMILDGTEDLYGEFYHIPQVFSEAIYREDPKLEKTVHEVIMYDAMTIANDVLGKYSYNDQKRFTSITEATLTIIDNVINKREVISLMEVIFQMSNGYMNKHPINVAVLSTIFAIKLGLNLETVESIAMGGLLHDIGKTVIFEEKPELAFDNYKYTADDFRKMQTHTILGYEIVKNMNLPPLVKKIILFHHVWEDYTHSFDMTFNAYKSYPMSYLDREITSRDKCTNVSIVQIADVFDSMINSKRVYHQVHFKKDALDYIRRMADIQFDSLAILFTNFIYPFGLFDTVRLNTGDIGKVIELTLEPKRPVILLKTGAQTGKKLNLAKSSHRIKILGEVN